MPESLPLPAAPHRRVAVIGLAGRFPGAPDLESFWRNLAGGVESVSTFSDEELLAAGVDPELLRDPRCVRARGVLDGAELFDADFFGYKPKEAEIMDPQQRLLLECAWEALESSGYDSYRYPGRIGVFAGASVNTYHLNHLLPNRELVKLVGPYQVRLLNRLDMLCTRISYKLGLRGPSLAVQTACSTSLVAVHLACQSLLSGECDMALAGGVSVVVPQPNAQLYQEGGILSPDGHCRPFDARAQGAVAGNGLGLVVLKRLDRALADGDAIHAVLLGSAVNNDGSAKAGYTAPGIGGQAEVIAEALAMAEVPARSLGFVEAHGTATPIGDPIEMAALVEVFRKHTADRGFCALGAVKSNFGHLDAAAGIAGLIKTVLTLKHGVIPPTLHFERPNPELRLDESPFYVSSRAVEWPATAGPRRAGVSSFGIGGTNAHVVLEQAPALPCPDPGRGRQLLVLSARTESALAASASRLAAFLERRPDLPLADAAWTLQAGRHAFPHRLALAAGSPADAALRLASGDRRIRRGLAASGAAPETAFLFPGQGSQRSGMGAELYEREAVFRETMDLCAELLAPRLGCDLRQVLYHGDPDTAGAALQRTSLSQTAIFATGYALAQQWIAWGVRPSALLGHSVGEYVAGCLAGVFPLATALDLVACRGLLMEELPEGVMLAVPLPAEQVEPLLGLALSLAAVNEPARCVVAGPAAAVEALEGRLAGERIACRRLRTAHAFHSAMVEPVLERFRRIVERSEPRPPQVPFFSTVTGGRVHGELADPDYWVRHLRQPVLFSAALGALLASSRGALLEAGPGRTLTAMATRHPARGGRPVIASLSEEEAEETALLDALGGLWCAGVEIDWLAVHRGERRRRVPLPTYPFERRAFWVEPPARRSAAMAGEAPAVTAAEPRSAPGAGALEDLKALVAKLCGLDAGSVDPDATFLDLGFDSLLMMQASQAVQDRFGVAVPFRRLFQEVPTLRALAEQVGRSQPARAEPEPAVAIAPGPDGLPLEKILAQQMVLLEQQMELLRRLAPARATAAPAAVPAPEPAPAAVAGDSERHGPWRPVSRTGSPGGLTARQQERLAALVERHTARTRGSKALAGTQRRFLADNRLSAGFRLLWKELVYPLAAARSRGSRMWDVDGNEYVDLVMGYGVNLFGHAPDFVREALHAQIDEGIHIGAQTPLAGEVAELFCRLTGAERAAFCNTGSEAVMAAVRIARTVTRRDTVALFSGSYHGISDGVLARLQKSGRESRPVPVAPGIPPRMVKDLLILDYGSPESLEILERRAGELAAVLVEPVQSARPDLQPREFLQELRRLTERAGTALIFDEMISGFRIHPGGAQAWFGVRADLATYGKVAGGGLPIGVIAGRAAFLDAVDGGAWEFGDGSFPRADQTFFAGTFCKHPLALAASRAVLRHLEAAGPGCQEDLNRRAAGLVERLDAVFVAEGVPVRMACFGSLLKPVFPADLRFAPLLYFHLAGRGVHIWEGRSWFLSTAHTDEDLELVEQAVRESVAEMKADGFLPGGAAATEHVLPLTEAQERLWAVTQMGEDASRAYNESLALHLRGPLDVEALREAIRTAVNRHEALRTTFAADGRTQVIHPAVLVDVPLEDLSQPGLDERERLLTEWAARESGETFDLVQGPLLRFRLLRLAEGHHVLLRTVHHLAADGWSSGILLNEIALLYAARRQREPCRLPEPVRWSDWVERQLALARESEGGGAASGAYWRERFAGSLPVLDLPADRPRSRMPEFAGGRVSSLFGKPVRDALAQAAAAQGASLSMFLLAVFQALLFRLSGQRDLVVSVPSAGQTGPGGGYLVGYCVNLLPVRVRIDGEAPFAAHLAEVRQALLDASEHQGYPFLRLIDRLAPERDLGRSPLHLATFNLDRSRPRLEMADLAVDFTANPPRGSKFEVYLNITDRGDRLVLDWDYSADLFDVSTVRRWAVSFQTLCEAAAADPGRRVAALRWLTEAERAQLATEWNDTQVDGPSGVCVHQLIEACAERDPDALALLFEGEALTYGQLEERANRVANRLVALGAGPELPVGLCTERSFELVVGLLAILKAGSVYVPLDPGYPRERLALLVADSGMPLVLAQQRFAERLVGAAAQVLCLDGDGWEREPADRPRTSVGPDHLAYSIYTSGSTGMPKGAMNTHRGICNRLLWMQRTCGLEPGDRVLQKTPFSFDVSLWELFGPLLAGARLFLARPEGHRDPAYLVDVIAGEGVTVAHFVPSMLEAFLEEPSLARCGSLRRVITSGEALPRALQARFQERLPGVELRNLYGPTEAAVEVTSWVCDPADPGPIVPIGRPIDNVEIHLLDGEGEPVPIGVTGELYIGGVAPARGYSGRPDLTAAAFVPHPLARVPGDRLYRSGDLARRRPDGAVEFLGRVDNQVKLRGVRVELGEIESALRLHPGVESAVVALREDVPGDRRLAAYVVPEGRSASPVRRLARLQREGLPSGSALCELPNGLAALQIEGDQNGLAFQSLRQGVDLGDGDCIVEAGAGVGLFTLLAAREVHRPEILACEADPARFGLLRANMDLHGVEAALLACRLAGAEAQPSQRTLSGLLHERGLRRIDLLRIGATEDAHGVLRGIAEPDWAKIRQIVAEEPAGGDSLAALFEERGYRVAREPGALVAALPPRKRLQAGRRMDPEVRPETWSSPGSLAQSLQSFLRSQLPDPLVPSDFVMLDALPLTTSGKVDRRALPAPQRSAMAADRPRVVPRDGLEEVLAAFWTEVLGRDAGTVGVEDDFFHSGGYSLLAIRLAARLREVFQVQLTLRDMVSAPTVGGLALALRAREAAPGQMDKIARVYKRLQQMSPDEVAVALRERQSGRSAS